MVKLPFSFKSSRAISRFLTVDVGSDAVKCMIFEVGSEGGRPIAYITGIGKAKLPDGSTRGGVIVDIEDVSESLDEAIAQAAPDSTGAPREVIFGVSGGLSLGLMTTVRVNRRSEEPISEKELNVIYAKVNEAAYTQAQNLFLEQTGNSDLDFKLVTSSIVCTKVDDRAVLNPIGATGQKLELAVFTAFTPSYHIIALKDLSKNLGLKIIAVGSQMYALVKSLSYSRGTSFDGVVMDVGGEVTDVGVVFGGGIVATKNIELGGTHFTRSLAKGLDLSFEDAEFKKKEYSFGRLQETEALMIKGYLDEVLDVWLHGIEILFQDFTGVKTFAPNIMLVGGGAELPDLYDLISCEPWMRSIPFKSPPEFSKISLEDLKRVKDKTGKAHSLEDVMPAALSTIYLEILGGSV